MSAQHTPGPWWATDYGVRDVGGYICTTAQVSRYEDQEERFAYEVAQRQADTRLIAAAPELLAACRAQHRAIDILLARVIELDHLFMPTKWEHWPALIAGNAAIAKATGSAQ